MDDHVEELVSIMAAIDPEDHPDWMAANRYGVERALASMDEIRRHVGSKMVYAFARCAIRARREYLEGSHGCHYGKRPAGRA